MEMRNLLALVHDVIYMQHFIVFWGHVCHSRGVSRGVGGVKVQYPCCMNLMQMPMQFRTCLPIAVPTFRCLIADAFWCPCAYIMSNYVMKQRFCIACRTLCRTVCSVQCVTMGISMA